MGMFDKDKAYGLRLDSEFKPGEHFVMWGTKLGDGTIDTDFGAAEYVKMTVSKLNNPSHKYECQTLASAIVEKCKDAEASDFPAVVKLDRVKGRYRDNTLVLQFVGPYDNYAEPTPDDDLPF